MSFPSPDELPAPPAGKTGWPWDVPAAVRKQPLPPLLPDGTPWPRITVVTPSYNQAIYLEETIRSVLLQGYPNLEYMVMDGGSSDGSPAIIQKYAPWLAHWESERDRGQSHAINKGFTRATGDWLGWRNSDDWYNPGALRALIMRARAEKTAFVSGGCVYFMENVPYPPRRMQPEAQAFAPPIVRYAQLFDQPACLWRREIYEQVGPLDEALHYTFDWDFFIKALGLVAESGSAAVSDATIAFYRFHAAHKTTGTGGSKRKRELITVYRRYLEPDQQIALTRAGPWLPLLWRLREIRRSHGANPVIGGLLRVVFGVIRRLVLERPPALHPYICAALELPLRSLILPQRAQRLTPEQATWRWIDDAAFGSTARTDGGGQ